MNINNIYLKAIFNILAFIVTCLIIIFIIPKIIKFFMPFIIGWIIAMIANPLVKFLEKKIKIVRKHSSVLIIILTLGLVIVIIYFSVLAIAREIIDLVTNLPNIIVTIEEQFGIIVMKTEKILPDAIIEFINTINSDISKYIQEFMGDIKIPSFSQAGIMAKSVVEMIFMIFITILSSYFFIAERENITDYLYNNMPKSILESMNFVINNFKKAIGGYLKAQFKIMIILLIIMFIGFEILGIGYSFLIALGVAAIDFLPVFGMGAVIWPWAVVELFSNRYFNAIGLMIIYIICQIIRQVLQPKMVGDSIGMSPLGTLFFMFIGYKLRGIVGLIIAIPIGMIIINFYKAGVFENLKKSIEILLNALNNFRKLD